MEPRGEAKKDFEAVSMDVDEPSYDILEWFPIGYCEDVFKHLDGKAIKQASEVNKEWRNFCAESKQAAKLKLVFNAKSSQKLDRQAVDIMRGSQRHYQNIEFRNIPTKSSKFILEVLKAGAGRWKSVKFDKCELQNQDLLLQVLQVIEPSVEDLSTSFDCRTDAELMWLLSISFGHLPDSSLDAELAFPCLKRLHVDDPSSRLGKMFVQCTQLVKLHLQTLQVRPIGAKLKLLRNNRSLEDLLVSADELTIENITDFEFKLKKLSLFGIAYEMDPEIIRYFLQMQAETLESLEIEALLSRDSWELILSMPKLTSLKIRSNPYARAVPEEVQPFQVNATITSLEMSYFGCRTPEKDRFENFIRALPNLKHFKCDETSVRLLRILAREVPALESLETTEFLVSRWPEEVTFPNMKTVKVGTVLQTLQEPTGDDNFAKLIRAEMKIRGRNRLTTEVVDSSPSDAEWTDVDDSSDEDMSDPE